MTTIRAPRALSVASLVALFLAAPSPAHAQPQDRTGAAQVAFQRGIAEMDARRYPTALAALEESYRLYPSPVALYNIALAHREMGHVQRAVEAFERYLTEGGARVPAERITAVRDTLRQLREQVATVTLTATPTPFAAVVDGRDAALTDGALSLDPGEHVLVVTAPGRRPWREEVRLAPGQRVTRSVTLEPDGTTAPAPAAGEAAPTTMPPTGTTPHPREGPRAPAITSRWWFWTGLAVIVVGGVVAGVAIATSGGSEPPLPGTAFDVQTLRAP